MSTPRLPVPGDHRAFCDCDTCTQRTDTGWTVRADLTPAQAGRLEAIEAAPYAEEAAVERVAKAIWTDGLLPSVFGRKPWEYVMETTRETYRHMAVAAIDVMRGAGRHAGDLLCTYCGGPLLLEMTTATRDDTETVEPDNLQCCDVRCGATWETDGTLRMAGTGHPDVMRGATDDGAVGRVLALADELDGSGGADWHTDVAERIRTAVGAPATAEGDDRPDYEFADDPRDPGSSR